MSNPPAVVSVEKKAAAARLEAMALALLSTASFQGSNVTIRMVADTMHPFEIGFFRNLLALPMLAPSLMRAGWGSLATKRFPLHFLRALLNFGAITAMFVALANEPLARVVAITFSAPLFGSLGALIVFRERLYGRRIVVLLAGFAGAMLIVRPGFQEISLGTAMALLYAVFWALVLLSVKSLSRTESPVTMTIYNSAIQVPIALAASLFFWTWPALREIGWLLALAGFSTVAQIALAHAFRRADATLVISMDYFKLIWASIIGYALFAEVPDARDWIGGAIICASVTYLAQRERAAARRGE